MAFAALVILHEFGHFIAAKAVGMRVERFSLFFPPAIFKIRRGETSYEIGAIPLGGFVKITGMSPEEEIEAEILHRAYHRQPVWKRIVTIAAGPAMNFLIAFLLIFSLYAFIGVNQVVPRIDKVDKSGVAAGRIAAGDQIISVNGKTGKPKALTDELNRVKCAGRLVDGCKATRSSTIVVKRAGATRAYVLTPVYDANNKRMRVGVSFAFEAQTIPPGRAFTETSSGIWNVTKMTATLPSRIFDDQKRKELSSVAGGYKATQVAIERDGLQRTIEIIALISLSLAIINLFPFLPLDGGHIFWALAEKVRGRPIPISVMERASMVGIVLIVMLFAVGLSNDIERFRSGFFDR